MRFAACEDCDEEDREKMERKALESRELELDRRRNEEVRNNRDMVGRYHDFIERERCPLFLEEVLQRVTFVSSCTGQGDVHWTREMLEEIVSFDDEDDDGADDDEGAYRTRLIATDIIAPSRSRK
jgi:hypothetical protein